MAKNKCIQFYLDAGFTLFPLVGKIPPKGLHWRECQFDPFFECPLNFGVQLSADDLVVDVDPRNGGLDSLILLKPYLSPTLRVITGSGGCHYYFKKPPAVAIKKNLSDYPGIDFISLGGYVVGAGSIHPETEKSYLLKEAVITKASLELIDLIQKPSVVLGKGLTHGKYNDDEQTKERYRDYLNQIAAAVQGEAGDRHTFAVAAYGRDLGLSAESTLGLLEACFNPRCQPPWTIEDLTRKVNNVYLYAKNDIGVLAPQAVGFPKFTPEQESKIEKELDKWLQRSKSGVIKPNLNNTAVLFSKNFPLDVFHNLLGFNQFSNNIDFLRAAPWHFANENIKSWSDGEAVRARFFISNWFKFEPTTQTMHDAAYKASLDHKFHPVKDYLDSLSWDGHKRAHLWLSTIMGADDNSYVRAIGLKFLVAAVKRIYEPGCKFDYLLTFESRQGGYKSQAFEILAVNKDWYADPSLDVTNKDSVILLMGKWIVELPEMHTHYRAETTAMKAFLSRSVDRIRLPYDKLPKDVPRQCVLAGTINPDNNGDVGWLKDPTGNRRYWPVPVSEGTLANLDDLRKIRDQLWAEAYQLYKEGVKVFLEDASIETLARGEQVKRMGVDSWQDSIERWVYSSANLTINIFSGEEIFKFCIGGTVERYSNKEAGRISRCMENLGWKNGVHWDPEAKLRRRGYKRPEII